ncbi:MAG: transglutaminase-like domain-containing protein [Eubacteriales bacterium]
MKRALILLITIIISVFMINPQPSVFAAGESIINKSGITTVKNTKAVIDITNAANGYFTASYLAKTNKNVKVIVEKGDKKLTYNLKNNGDIEIYPLQLGDGKYLIKVLTQLDATKYSVSFKYELDLKLSDSKAPFLVPNQLVEFSSESKVIKKAAELVKNKKTVTDKVSAIYNYVIKAMTYDKSKASDISAGKITTYIPDIDEVVESGKGICYDYAAVFAAMLRSQGIPAKLVMGYVSGNQYHAWNEFYIENVGWFRINEMSFNGNTFNRMDPTFDSTGNSTKTIMKFIGNGSNYTKLTEY